MTAPRRPAAGRRPASSRGRTGRPQRSGAARAARTSPRTAASASRGATTLTHRAAVLGLVVTTLVLSAALPVREYLDQRADIATLEQEQAAARERVEVLEEAKQQLQDPAFIAAEARRRLHMARPGEVTYLLITPTPEPVAGEVEGAPPAGPDAPWWSQVWGSVRAADSPPAPAAPQPSPAAPQPSPAAP